MALLPYSGRMVLLGEPYLQTALTGRLELTLFWKVGFTGEPYLILEGWL
jgi:hypothetical protein